MLTTAFFILVLLAFLIVLTGFMDAANRIILSVSNRWDATRDLTRLPFGGPAKVNLF